MTVPAGPGPYAPPPPKASGGALVMLLVGLVTMVGGGILAFVGVIRVGDAVEGGLLGEFDQIGSEVRVPEAPGSSTVLDVEVTEGGHSIYARVAGPTGSVPDTTSAGPVEPGSAEAPSRWTFDIELSVTGPDGEEVELHDPGLPALIDTSPGRLSVRTFTADRPGTHRITVARAELPDEDDLPVETVGVRRANLTGEGFGQALAGGVAIGLGVLAGIIGFPLFVAGGIWWLISRSRSTQTPGPPPGGWAPPGGWPAGPSGQHGGPFDSPPPPLPPPPPPPGPPGH